MDSNCLAQMEVQPQTLGFTDDLMTLSNKAFNTVSVKTVQLFPLPIRCREYYRSTPNREKWFF